MLATIPFSGFYNSLHDSEFDQVLEREFDYFAEETGHNMPESLVDRLQDCLGRAFGDATQKYAQEYAESFLDWLGLEGKFESMDSPREYNFTTDRIFVELTRSDVAKMWRGVDRETFDRVCAGQFTSRSGFRSFYNGDWRTWGKLSEWDHNQLGALVIAYTLTEDPGFDSYGEYNLMENAFCNGDIESWLCENDDFARAWNLSYWMRERCQRAPYTMADHYKKYAKSWESTPLGGCA